MVTLVLRINRDVVEDCKPGGIFEADIDPGCDFSRLRRVPNLDGM